MPKLGHGGPFASVALWGNNAMNPSYVFAGIDDWMILVFIAISIISSLLQSKNKATKKAQQKNTPQGSAPPPASPLEEFFKRLADQVNPAGAYEVEPPEFEWIDDEEEPPPAPAYIPPPIPVQALEESSRQRHEPVQLETHRPTHIPSGSQGLRMPGMSHATGSIRYNLRGKKALRHAILGQLIFSPPRAYNSSFDNTITK